MKKLPIKQDLISFEEEIAAHFNNADIKAPIHLYSGNEDNMLSVFKMVNEDDWVMCSWRSHYQCLLKGVPREQLKKDIIEGRSISLCYSKYNIVSSGIVTGILPIAVGIALSIQRSGAKNKVYCFMGDMTSESGMAYECIKYSIYKKLPIHFIIEDNGMSVCTPTREAWGSSNWGLGDLIFDNCITYYKYENKYPHAGSGTRIQF